MRTVAVETRVDRKEVVMKEIRVVSALEFAVHVNHL